MTISQVWGALLIFTVCPLLGAMPFPGWIVQGMSGQQLRKLGTGNISVSAAFYHGGRWAGVLSALAEAAKGIAAVLLARQFFSADPTWEVIALIGLVMGRYWFAQGAGTTNVTWGFIVHDPVVSGLTFLISGLFFTLARERRQGRLLVLVLLPVLTALRHPQGGRIAAVAALAGLIAWIYQKIPDDLDLESHQGRLESQKMFRFFRGDRALLSFEQPLAEAQVGAKAATLAQLRQWGYPVPMGYVLPPGDDPAPLLAVTQLSPQQPVVVRSSAIGEDGETASAAGQYLSILNVTTTSALATAITRCYGSYHGPAAIQYRRDRDLPDTGMAVIVQQQISGVFSGVAFSRDPISRAGDAVVIEALPGAATQVVSGQQTPEQYRVGVQASDIPAFDYGEAADNWQLPAALDLVVEGKGQVPQALLQQVAFLARHLEVRYCGVPQDIEWSFDGTQLWLLQSRPITTLTPIWTRKIAAEVIPGTIRPLTWAINRPLTCGVWGDIFTLVLGKRADGLEFAATATLHHSYAYFNATLLGNIFLRMGLPPESLEFLTRGAKFSKPPLTTTLRNLLGLLRLAGRELWVAKDFAQADRTCFTPALDRLQQQPCTPLDDEALLDRIDRILESLTRITYYNILVPLSFALRKTLWRVPDALLDSGGNPEVMALRDLESLAVASRSVLGSLAVVPSSTSALFAALAENPDGQGVLDQLQTFLDQYGYLSQVGTDIAVPTWLENPRPVRELFAQYLLSSGASTGAPNGAPTVASTGAPNGAPTNTSPEPAPRQGQSGSVRRVQRRLDLKGRVNEIYSRLLAELRWSFIALGQRWVKTGLLDAPDDIFFLEFDEIRQVIEGENASGKGFQGAIAARKASFEQDQAQATIPALVYGYQSPNLDHVLTATASSQSMQGIGASPGQIEGDVQVITDFQGMPPDIDGKILVVPYTDAGWAPLLARAGGLIAEVGGRLSHGAIVAREYGIPAVMDISQATQRLHNGQRVRLDGEQGTVEVLCRGEQS